MVSDTYVEGPPAFASAAVLPAAVAQMSTTSSGPPPFAAADVVPPAEVAGTTRVSGVEAIFAHAGLSPAAAVAAEIWSPPIPPQPPVDAPPYTLDVELYDRAFTRLGWLNDFTSLSVTWRHNRRDVATVVVPADHLRASQLVEPGRRVVITYTPAGGTAQTMSGRIGTVQAQGPRGASSLVATVLGDWVDGALAWPVPGSALDAQITAYWAATGPAETVIKSIITANAVARLGLPFTVAADQSRGSSVSISARMVPLSDAVEAAADLGGVGLRVVQSAGGSTVDVDCYAGADRSARVLSEESGSLTGWSLTVNAPKATRAVVGLQGEGTERTFLAVTDAIAEADWGLSEMFVDADDLTSLQFPEGTQRGADKLSEQAATISVTATLAESNVWQFGRTLFLGDTVSVEPVPGLLRVEQVREARLTFTPDNGLVVEPVLGDPDAAEPERAMASHVSRLAAAVRLLRTR